MLGFVLVLLVWNSLSAAHLHVGVFVGVGCLFPMCGCRWLWRFAGGGNEVFLEGAGLREVIGVCSLDGVSGVSRSRGGCSGCSQIWALFLLQLEVGVGFLL